MRLAFVGKPRLLSMIFNNIPLLFAMGVAYGMSRNEKGIAIFTSLSSYLMLNVTISTYRKLTGTMLRLVSLWETGQKKLSPS